MNDVTTTRNFTMDEMLERLGIFFERPFTMTDFTEQYESSCPGGEYEDAGIVEDLKTDYPNLCAGQFNESEWAEFVVDTFWNLYNMDILAPHFPRD